MVNISVYLNEINKPMPAISKREQIISTALMLFYQHGFHATGIDKIIKQAGVSKKTLYNHFESKDELILETLKRRDEVFTNKMIAETERLAKSPKTRLLSIFDAHDLWFNEKTFSGCMFINASAEFASHNDPFHLICAKHKRNIKEYLYELAKQAHAQDAELLSQQLSLLLEGAIVDAYVSGNTKAAITAKSIAQVIIRQAIE
ncbi:MAG: TetR/AcrR family transcriptional regulator [Cycloclasticus sp.]